MSHFAVIIIGENPETQLVPYNEQDKNYMSFVDETKKIKREYKTKKTSEFYCQSNSSWGMEIPEKFYKKLSRTKIGEEFEQDVQDRGFHYYSNDACIKDITLFQVWKE